MKTYFLAIAALAMSFAACTNEEEEQIFRNGEKGTLESPVAIDFSAGITTRVIGNEWETGDFIGISATDGADANYTNVKYEVAEGGPSATFNTANGINSICYKSENAMSFKAYYPYAKDNEMSEGKIERNTAQTQDKVDFLWATIENKPYSAEPKVNFTFQHKMAQINVKITSGVGDTTNGKSVVISGLKHDGGFDTQTGIAAPNTNINAEDWTIGKMNSQDFSYTGLIYPQNALSITLKVGDGNDGLKTTLNLGNIGKFDAGYKYTITATVEDGKINAHITINGNIIEDWKDGSIAPIAFIGDAETAEMLEGEGKAAYDWLVSNSQYKVTYFSINGNDATINLEQYKMIWAHFDKDNSSITSEVNTAIANYYISGGSVLASRDAMYSLIGWGIISDSNKTNWNFGNSTNERKPIDWEGTQGFTITQTNHKLFDNLPADYILIHQREYPCIRKMRGWGENYTADDLENWEKTAGAQRLARDGGKENSITIAEIFKTTGHGCAIIIGDPSFEWYGSTPDNSNINALYTFTTNAINYLINQVTQQQ